MKMFHVKHYERGWSKMLTLDGMNLMCDETLIATVPMATISILETALKGQEEMAILLEEQARRIATLQESLKQVCHNPHSNDRVIMQEVDRLVKERNELRRRLENAELLIERLKAECALRTAEESSVVDSTHAKQPEDSSNADGDGDSVIDDNPLQVELVRLAEKSLGEVTE